MSFEALEAEWRAVTASAAAAAAEQDRERVRLWSTALAAMQAEVQRSSGDWRGGPRTLLAAMGVQDLEVPLTAAVAWLLRPDGHHGLGDAFLRRFLHRAGVEADLSRPVRIVVEEAIGDTRADLLVRVAGATVLVESKVNAPEQDEQLDRLADRWGHEQPVLVFLTRTAREPTTAVVSRGQWQGWLWSDVAEDLRACLSPRSRQAPGVDDLLQTLETYHRPEGGPVSDPKTDFYLRHWRQIEEWAALRADARQVFEAALRQLEGRAAQALGAGVAVVGEQLTSGPWPHVSVLDPSWQARGSVVKLAVAWNRAQLLNAAGESWPYVGIHVDTAQPHARLLRAALSDQVGETAGRLGWTRRGTYWPAYRYIEPAGDDVDPGAVADECLQVLLQGWAELSPGVEAAVQAVEQQLPAG